MKVQPFLKLLNSCTITFIEEGGAGEFYTASRVIIRFGHFDSILRAETRRNALEKRSCSPTRKVTVRSYLLNEFPSF